MPWCSGYHYHTTSFDKAWSCSRRVGDSRLWGSLAMTSDWNGFMVSFYTDWKHQKTRGLSQTDQWHEIVNGHSITTFPQFLVRLRQQLTSVNRQIWQVWQICEVLIIHNNMFFDFLLDTNIVQWKDNETTWKQLNNCSAIK